MGNLLVVFSKSDHYEDRVSVCQGREADAGCRMPDAARWYIHLLVNDLLSDKFEDLSADHAD